MNQQTISGTVSNLRIIPTRTGLSMAAFTVGDKKCKAFGNVADACASLDGVEVQIEGKEGSFRGEKEYAVTSVRSKVDGQEVSATDTRKVPAQKLAPTSGPAPAGMVRWNVRPGEREHFRSEILKYGTARMLELFDKLPHPDCSEEQWQELMEEYHDNKKAHAEELRGHARNLGYSDEEIMNYASNTGGAFDWKASKASVIADLELRRQLYGPRGTTAESARARPSQFGGLRGTVLSPDYKVQ
jgi:hypothetical protein